MRGIRHMQLSFWRMRRKKALKGDKSGSQTPLKVPIDSQYAPIGTQSLLDAIGDPHMLAMARVDQQGAQESQKVDES